MPASSSSAAACPRPAPYARPATRPRRAPPASSAADPALDTLGAVYIGWGAGKQDPAPLCCAVQARASLVRAFGEAAIGWMTVQRQQPPQAVLQKPQPRLAQPTSATAALPSLPLGALPPLPPLPRTRTASSLSTVSFVASSSPSPPLAAAFAPSPLGGTTSTPPASVDVQIFEDAVQKDRAASFDDTTLALPLAAESRPTSPRLDPSPLVPPAHAHHHHSAMSFVPSFALSLASVPESVPDIPVVVAVKSEEGDFDDEALWSAGEDPLWNCAATDVMSEASWAW
ncbi:hypothetical protein JCM3770_003201 [Rhodotorula araucariae]